MNPFNSMFDSNQMVPNNPFAWNSLTFEIHAVHDMTGSSKEGIMTINIPSTATEHQARKMIMELALQAKWRLVKLKRVDNQEHQEPSF